MFINHSRFSAKLNISLDNQILVKINVSHWRYYMSELLELNDFRRWDSVNKLYCSNVVSYAVLAIPL
ncbi:hypothetical protein CFB3_38690 [Clostridium folliculivorans]|uniref:Uncharacterized protein n=1 Tax=Clostridium folliculivorans TaxID=2886038 RepID=A0A9W5Y5V8_9CLOT|nr:hypothetical protein CFOLD11_39720 [Clostridium folliculivorans]GKU31762.1 hypothetical protein CFB3_38690 [Clostridium folliculivorans]